VKTTLLRQEFPKAISRWGVPLAILAFLWLTRSNEVTLAQFSLALFLTYVPWHSYLAWKKAEESDLPIFSMISFMYCLYYVMPLFWEPHTISELNAPLGRELSESSVTKAMLMVVVGVSSLWLGMRIGLGRLFAPRRLSFEVPRSRWHYIRAILVVGCLLNIYDISPYSLGEGGRQLMNLLLAVVPMLAFAILFRSYLRRDITHVDRILMLAFVVSRLVNGLSSGWLGVSMSLILICGVIYIAERRRIPQIALVLIVLFILFFQVGKEDFRKTYWQQGSQGMTEAVTEGGKIERATFWVRRSFEKWGTAWDDPTGQTLKDAIIPSVSRVSLLNQTANVIDLTPSVVPYQYGQLYSYLGVTLIPRAFWPEKPSISEANQFYQVAYGLTSEDQLSQVSIAVGTLTEAFINFSWAGVVGVMFLMGVFFDLYRRAFFSPTSGSLMGAIGVVLLPQMISIESQMAVYLGGIIQHVLFTLLIFLPVMKLKRPAKPVAPVGALIKVAN